MRAWETEELSFLYEIENGDTLWEVSNTQTPYSKWLLKNYLENSHQDIYEAKQLRLAIVEKSSENLIGLIDLYDFDPKNSRVGLGIVVKNPSERNKGFGSESVKLLLGYAFQVLNVHQIFVNVAETNSASIKLFSNLGFQRI